MRKCKYFMKVSLYLLMCVSLIMLVMAGCDNPTSSGDNSTSSLEFKSGYLDAEYEGTTDKGATFLACGTGGRLDRIFEDGTVENIPLPVGDKALTKVLITEDLTLVGGESGALVYSRDGKEFKPSKGVGKEHILGLTQFKGKYYACTYSGKILSSSDGVSWKVGKKLSDKPLIAIAANRSYLMAITEDTDIFKSEDGVDWDMQNYNTVYKDLADLQLFQKVVNIGENMYIIGQLYENPDVPCVMYSSDGGDIWIYVNSLKINKRPPEEFYPLTIYSVRFFVNELLAACDRGRLLTFTDCPSCNTIADISNVNLRCIAVSENIVLVAGDDFEFSVLSAEELRELNALASEPAIAD